MTLISEGASWPSFWSVGPENGRRREPHSTGSSGNGWKLARTSADVVAAFIVHRAHLHLKCCRRFSRTTFAGVQWIELDRCRLLQCFTTRAGVRSFLPGTGGSAQQESNRIVLNSRRRARDAAFASFDSFWAARDPEFRLDGSRA